MDSYYALRLPSYARYAFEAVRTLHLQVWFENGSRWVRLDVLRDLLGNDAPFVVRVFTEGEKLSEPWRELEDGEYPWWRAETAEEAIQSCLDGLAERGPIQRGMANRPAK